jgi:hypothetical protein
VGVEPRAAGGAAELTTPAPAAHPLPFRILLDEAVRLSRRHFRRLYPAVAIPLAVIAGAATVVQGLFYGSVAEIESAPNPALMIGGAVGFVVSMLAFLLVYTLSYGVLLMGAIEAVAGREVSMSRAWRFVLRPRVLGTNLLATIVVAAGFVCCILPGIYLALLFSFTVPVMAEEGVYGTAALRRSAELARYNPQRSLESDPRVKVFVILFVGTLLGYGINMLIQLPLILMQQYLMFRDIARGDKVDPAQMMARMTWLQVPSQIVSVLINTAVHLYVCFGLALLFFDLKGRKEGLDLETAIARLAAPPETPA